MVMLELRKLTLQRSKYLSSLYMVGALNFFLLLVDKSSIDLS